MKRRIIRADAYNWAIQEWQEGGGTIERGRFAGQAKQAKWKNPEAFYSRLADAATGMLNDIIGDVPQGEVAMTGQNLVTAITLAEERTRNYLAGLVQALDSDTMIGVLQERGYVVTTGKKGRSSYVEEDDSPDSP